MGATFTTVENDGKKCMRLLVANNKQMKGAIIYDVGTIGHYGDCKDSVHKVKADITPDTWLVLSERFVTDYYTTEPFQIRVMKSTVMKVNMSPASATRWPTYQRQHVVYADVVNHTLTLGGTAPIKGFKGVAFTDPPPKGFKEGAWNPVIYTYIAIGAAVIVVIVLAITLPVVLTRKHKLQQQARAGAAPALP
jgi:hypothetical protein